MHIQLEHKFIIIVKYMHTQMRKKWDNQTTNFDLHLKSIESMIGTNVNCNL